jgi:DNA primase
MAGLVSPATLEQIRAASDIVDIIGASLPLKRAGANFVTLCPFHKEKTPSFNVNPQRQIFHCFGCHKGGDVFTFVCEYENLGFPEAIRRLAERAGIPLEFDRDATQQPARQLKDTLLKIHEEITQRWHHALLNEAAGQAAREYLAKRQVSDEAVKLFRLGCAPDAWDDTVNWARSKDYDLSVVEQAGLIIRKEGESRHYDRFRGRLMFPICDEQGRVIAFSGRVLSGDEQTAKYVNSPETPLFTKGKVMFGLDKSKRALLAANSAVVCEGQLDLIACYMAGVQNVVAPQGTAFTADHARILKRYVEEVVLCFDSDTAGRNATVRALDDLLASGLAIRVARLPAPHDPDSYIKANGADAFRQLLERAEGFFDFYLSDLCAANDLATDRGRLAVVRSMAEAVYKTGSPVLADTYAQRAALLLAVSPESVRAEFRKAARPVRGPATPAEETQPEPVSRPSPPEFWLMKLVLLNDDQRAWVANHLSLEWLQHPSVKAVVSLWLQSLQGSACPSIGALLTALSDATAQSLVTEAMADRRPIPNPHQQLTDLLVRLRNQYLDRQMLALNQRLGQAGLSDSEHTELLKKQLDLRLLKRAPLAPLIDASPARPGNG